MTRIKIARNSLAYFLVASFALVGVPPVASENGSLTAEWAFSSPAVVNGDDLAVGDIVAVGHRSADQICSFGVVKVRTTAPGLGRTRWLGMAIDSQCQVVVNAKWEGSLSEGPAAVIEPLVKLLLTESQGISEEPSLAVGTAVGLAGLSTLATKTSKQHVWMYGYGGAFDQLTHKNGEITFSYNGVTATITSQSGTCTPSYHGSYDWVVDACVRTGYNPGPAETVWRTGSGNYHCNPPGIFPCNLSNPDGYYHTLWENEDGHADGSSHCYFGWSGVIVAGVVRTIQGCTAGI